MKDIPLNQRIIVALDVESADQAKELVKKTESHINFYKVGLQLFMSSWFEIVDWLRDRGHKVMVDLKFFDIPETVKLAVASMEMIRSSGLQLRPKAISPCWRLLC
jgi:orotidine-5'-phosphate decarboxylase